MIEIAYSESNKKVFEIEPKSDKKFYIGIILNYNDNKSDGFIEEAVLPTIVSYLIILCIHLLL